MTEPQARTEPPPESSTPARSKQPSQHVREAPQTGVNRKRASEPASDSDHTRINGFAHGVLPHSDKSYTLTVGEKRTDNEIRSAVDLFITALELTNDAHMLDLCCGHGRYAFELYRRGFRSIEGVDRSHQLIQRARSQAKRNGLNVRFREGDARKLSFAPDMYDVVLIAGNSLSLFETAQDDAHVLEQAFRVLKPSGRILVDVTDGTHVRKHFQPQSWEWVDRRTLVAHERSLSSDACRIITREVVIDSHKGVTTDKFYTEHLFSTEEIARLLEEAGFRNATVKSIRETSQSNRGNGSAASRIIATGTAHKQWTPVRKTPRTRVTNIAVVMGDPKKRDMLKPSSIFDDDDFYTIDQAKAALKSLEQKRTYRFTYLDNHDSLIRDLMKLREKDAVDFVFNICDTGYRNDARSELHIPALLEMLDIPYTGAGPQSLAHCYDKSLVRGIATEMNIPVPNAFYVKPSNPVLELQCNFPVIVKPNFGDSSLGIMQESVANNLDELVRSINEVRKRIGYDRPLLIEEFLTGSEITVGIIGNPPDAYTVLPIAEEDYSALPPELPRICGYEAKWLPDSPYAKLRSVPARLDEGIEKNITTWCVQLMQRLDCRDYARFDWRFDTKGKPKLLEVNPNPGWCWDGHLAKMAHMVNMSYADMLGAILKAAQQRLKLNGI